LLTEAKSFTYRKLTPPMWAPIKERVTGAIMLSGFMRLGIRPESSPNDKTNP